MAYTNRSTNATVRKMLQMEGLGVSFATFSMNSMFRALLESVPKELYGTVKLYVEATSGSITRNRERRIKTIHRAVAEDALVSIRDSYSKSHIAKPTYGREGNRRYSGGLLGRALANPSMYRVGRDGLDFINPNWLDSQAKQWYRVNFGAGPKGKGTRPASRPRMVIFGTTVPGDLGLGRFPASPSFKLPPGGWKTADGKAVSWDAGRRGQDQFYPSTQFKGKHLRRIPTWSAGFQGTRFLDAGVNRIAKTLPGQYEKLFEEWFTEYRDTSGGPFAAPAVRSSEAEIQKASKIMLSKVIKLRTLN